MAAPVGEFGVIHHPMSYAQPLFDDIGGIFPAYHVLRGLARDAGQPLRLARSSRPGSVLAIACERRGETVIWIANLGEAPQTVAIDGLSGAMRCSVLEVG